METVSVAPSLLRKAMEATGTRTAETAVRVALEQTIELAEAHRLERHPRMATVRQVNKAMKGLLITLGGRGHLRRLTGV